MSWDEINAMKRELAQRKQDSKNLDARSGDIFSKMDESLEELGRMGHVAQNAPETLKKLREEAKWAQRWRVTDMAILFGTSAALFFAFFVAPLFFEEMDFSEVFSEKGLFLNVICGAVLSIVINLLVQIIYRAFIDKPNEYTSPEIYKVKPRKVIMWSNLIGSIALFLYAAWFSYFHLKSEVAHPALLAIFHDTAFWSRMNIGGVIITVYRQIADRLAVRNIDLEGYQRRFNGK